MARRRNLPPDLAGFTLVEVIIGSTLGSFVLAGVLSAFVMLARSGSLIYNYNGMAIEGRRALEEFSQDVRMARAVVWNSTDPDSCNSVTLTVPDNYTANANQVTYAYDTTNGTFYRKPGNAAATTAKTVLVRNVISGVYYRFDRLDAKATSDGTTKRLELSLRMRTGGTGTVAATENAISACYLLRNKPTS